MSKTLQPRRRHGETTEAFAARLNIWKNEIRLMQGKPLIKAETKIVAPAEENNEKKTALRRRRAPKKAKAAPLAAQNPESLESFIDRLKANGRASREESLKKQANATTRAQEQEQIAAVMARNLAKVNGTAEDEAILAELEADLANKTFTYGPPGPSRTVRVRPATPAAPAQQAVRLQPSVPDDGVELDDIRRQILEAFTKGEYSRHQLELLEAHKSDRKNAAGTNLWHAHTPGNPHSGYTFWHPELDDSGRRQSAFSVTPQGMTVHVSDHAKAADQDLVLKESILFAAQMYGGHFEVGNADAVGSDMMERIERITLGLIASGELVDHTGKKLASVQFHGKTLPPAPSPLVIQQPQPGKSGAPTYAQPSQPPRRRLGSGSAAARDTPRPPN